MSLIGSYSVAGPSASLTFTEEYSTLDELLIQLPNNTSNLIVAQDIRDSVLTLWNRINNVALIASQSSFFNPIYSTTSVVPVSLGGIPAGMSFSGTYSMQQMFDMLLYPYIAPSTSLTGGVDKEFGSSTSLTLNWSVVKNTNPITSIIVNGSPIIPTGNSQSLSQPANAIQDVFTTFTMTASDGIQTTSATTSVSWYNKRYWGTAASFGALNSAQIIALSGAGIGTGNALSTTLVANYDGINGSGQYLVFAWPTSFGTPTFKVNGMINTAFTKVNSSYAFSNAYSYVANYDVWMSNTVQNSPITLFEIF